jgi:hypothetical protein
MQAMRVTSVQVQTEKLELVKNPVDYTPPHIIRTDPSSHTHIFRQGSVLTAAT